jgi:hypothetical protein
VHPLWVPKLPVKAASAPGPKDAIASRDIAEAGNIDFQCWRNVTKRAISCLPSEGESARFTFSRGWAYLAELEARTLVMQTLWEVSQCGGLWDSPCLFNQRFRVEF